MLLLLLLMLQCVNSFGHEFATPGQFVNSDVQYRAQRRQSSQELQQRLEQLREQYFDAAGGAGEEESSFGEQSGGVISSSEAYFPYNSSDSWRYFHHPDSPKFELLLSQMRPIIPGHFVNSPVKNQSEDPNLPFVKSIHNLQMDLMAKLKPKPGSKQETVLKSLRDMTTTLLRNADLKKAITQHDLNRLMALFNDFFAEEKAYRHGTQKTSGRAPFTKLGEDCFDDVDHQEIAMEIKREALGLTSYLKTRMSEHELNNERRGDKVQFQVDALLTQTTALLAKLHRATLRNWHHILLIVGNFAAHTGNPYDALPPKILIRPRAEPTEPDKDPEVSRVVGERHSNTGKSPYDYECEMVFHGDAGQTKRPQCSTPDIWFEDLVCKSPLTKPISQCTSKVSWDKVKGQNLFGFGHTGMWEVSMTAEFFEDHPKEGGNDFVVGQLVKVQPTSSVELLLQIDHNVNYMGTKAKKQKTFVETKGSAKFDQGDQLLLRMAPSKHKMWIRFAAKYIA